MKKIEHALNLYHAVGSTLKAYDVSTYVDAMVELRELESLSLEVKELKEKLINLKVEKQSILNGITLKGG